MSERIKRIIAAMAALGALALGGAAIAGATGGGSDQGTTEQSANDQSEGAEQPGDAEEPGDTGNDQGEANDPADGNDQGEANDPADANDQGESDGELAAGVEAKATAAAEQATGGKAGEVEVAKQADPVEDANDQPTPKNAAYEVEITKGSQQLKVFLDKSFNPVATQADQG